MRGFAIVCLLALAGCEREPPFRVSVTTPDNSKVRPSLFAGYDTQPACEKAGGQWIAWCSPGTKSCVMTWPDAGKKCSDPAECASKTCMIETTTVCDENKNCVDPVIPAAGSKAFGVCKDMDVSCGSYIEVRKGIVQETYHID